MKDICRMCDAKLTTPTDRRRGLCPRCWADEARQRYLFPEPPVTVEGKQRLLFSEAGSLSAMQ